MPVVKRAPTMGMRALLDRIEKAALDTGLKDTEFRLDYKRNKAGELVIALIIPDVEGRPFSSLNVP
jgi:hypothetical protein